MYEGACAWLLHGEKKKKDWKKIKDWRRRRISCLLVTCGRIILWPHTREIYLRSEARQQTENANDTCGIIWTQLSHISNDPSINYVDGDVEHHSWPATCNHSTHRASAATYPSELMLTSSYPPTHLPTYPRREPPKANRWLADDNFGMTAKQAGLTGLRRRSDIVCKGQSRIHSKAGIVLLYQPTYHAICNTRLHGIHRSKYIHSGTTGAMCKRPERKLTYFFSFTLKLSKMGRDEFASNNAIHLLRMVLERI